MPHKLFQFSENIKATCCIPLYDSKTLFLPFFSFVQIQPEYFFPTENIFFSFDKKKSSICWYRCQGGRKTVFCLFVVIMISSFLIHRLLFWSLQGGNRLLDEAVNGWGCWRKKTVFLCRRKYEPAISLVAVKTDIRKNAIVYRRKVMLMAYQIALF